MAGSIAGKARRGKGKPMMPCAATDSGNREAGLTIAVVTLDGNARRPFCCLADQPFRRDCCVAGQRFAVRTLPLAAIFNAFFCRAGQRPEALSEAQGNVRRRYFMRTAQLGF